MSIKIDYTNAYDKTIEKYTKVLNKLKEIKQLFLVPCDFCSIHNKTKEKCPIDKTICICYDVDENNVTYYKLRNTLMQSRTHTRYILISLIENTIKP